MTSLKEARQQGNLSKFIKEHSGDPDGDAEAFEITLQAMSGTSSEAPQTSSQDDHDG
jgi:hypothetical protein